MAKAKILKECYKCHGIGSYTALSDAGETPVDPCNICNGEKWLETSRLDLTKFAVLETKLDTIISMLDAM